ncbi:hypothetical protein BDY21DRAFT_423015 [Lineolata rhizophorae]|uniref:Uncharacterized protein n=1 Tax=Lineolata rhizophorae TaxID=578093 RepID=A0A6A6NTZ5_9PEZI|nr:hypothetical protein BDY21DRAFT_423015 [Lineolata rhizophorae]
MDPSDNNNDTTTTDADDLPSYADSQKASSRAPAPSAPARPGQQSLVDSLTLSRAQHVRSVFAAHIWPLLSRQASLGLSGTTIALLPSDVLSSPSASPAAARSRDPIFSADEKPSSSLDDDPPPTVVEVQGLDGADADAAPLHQAQLRGAMDSAAFWGQPGVAAQLEREICERLGASSPSASPSAAAAGAPAAAPEPKRGFFGRKKGGAGTGAGAGDGYSGGVAVRPGVSVSVALEDVCLRTVSSFGLFDTSTKEVVVVRVRVEQ